MGNDGTKDYIIKMFDNTNKKIDRLNDKIDKVQDNQLGSKATKIIGSSVTLFIGVFTWLCVTTIDIKDVVARHDADIDTIQTNMKPLIVNNLKRENESTTKLSRVQLEIVKEHLNIRRKEQIPLSVFIKYKANINDPDAAGMFVLSKLNGDVKK